MVNQVTKTLEDYKDFDGSVLVTYLRWLKRQNFTLFDLIKRNVLQERRMKNR